MEVLTSLSPKIFARNGGRALSSAKSALRDRSDIGFSHFKKLNFNSLVLFSGEPARSVAKSHLTSDAQVMTSFDGAMPEIQDIKPSKTVHVKFKLQKKCMFGEQFLLVGDNPMFGLWNPSCAIPMNWSSGHVWTVEMDIPIELTLQFKFILRDITGEVIWQPGADRIFKTWNCKNTIVVTDAWENAEAQKITEEILPDQIEDLPINSGFDEIGGNVNYEVDNTGSINNPIDENMINADKEMTAEEYATIKKEEAMHSNNNPRGLYGRNLVTMEDEEKYFKYGEGSSVLVHGSSPSSKELGTMVGDASVGVDSSKD